MIGRSRSKKTRPRRRRTGAGSSHYYLILGTKEMGKTTLARLYHGQRIASGGRSVVVDPRAELWDIGDVVDSPRSACRALRDGCRSVVLQPGFHADIEDLWRPLYEIGHLLLFIDESHIFATAKRIDKGLARLIRTGRTRRVDIVMTCHRLVDCHGIYTGLLDVLCTFRQPKLHYSEQVADEFFEGRYAERVNRLAPGEYLRAANGHFSRGKITLPTH